MFEPPTPAPAFTSHRLYPAEEVDRHIQTLNAEIARLKAALDDAVVRAEDAERHSADLNDAEERVGRAFVVAQEAADATLRDAEQSAASVVAEARRRAELLLTKAREDALQVVEGARATVAELYAVAAGQGDRDESAVTKVISLDDPASEQVEVAPFIPPAFTPMSNGGPASPSAPSAGKIAEPAPEPHTSAGRTGDPHLPGDPSVVLPPPGARRFRRR